MSKILKVKIKRTQGGGKTSYTYPPQYNSQKFNVLVYESQLTGGYDKVVGAGNKQEIVIGMVQDADAAGFLASNDIVEITKQEADVFLGEDLDKTTEKITDQNAVLSVLAKVARKETLSADDLKVIDPKDSKAGITQSRSLNDALKEHGF